MRRLVAVAPFLLLVALLTACGGDDKPSSTPAPATFPGDTWQIEYTLSGGIAGMSQRLVLNEKGAATLEDVRLKRTREALVIPSDVALILGLLRAANLPSLKSDQGLPHPDAFVTSIKVTSGGQTFGGTFNTTPSSTALAALLQRMAAIYEANKP